MLADKVQRCVDIDENPVIVGDNNAEVNKNANMKTQAAKEMLEWETNKKAIIINDNDQPTIVHNKKGEWANYLDLGIVTPGLSTSVKKFTLNKKREWTPAVAIPVEGKTDKKMT